MPDKKINTDDLVADRPIKFFVYVILFIIYLFVAWLLWTPVPARRLPVQPTAEEKRWIEQRHKYHGIWASIEENGQQYFIRNGRKCKL
jgi:hypothetical protein